MYRRPAVSRAWLAIVFLPAFASCAPTGKIARLTKDNQALRRENERLSQMVAERDGMITALHRRIRELQGFGPDRPADLFAPVEIEIVSRSGGADYDGKPGDDGVTVYVRPRDVDGDTVKVPGRFRVQLMDNTDLSAPELIGVYRFNDLNLLRRAWYGSFGTRHYTLKCPFPAGICPPRNVDVKVEFVDFLTGRILTAGAEVAVSYADGA